MAGILAPSHTAREAARRIARDGEDMDKRTTLIGALVIASLAAWMVSGKEKTGSKAAPARVLAEEPASADAGPEGGPEPIAAGSLLADKVGYQLAVYHLPKATRDPVATLRRLVAEGGRFHLAQGDAFPEELPAIRARLAPASEYAPPDREFLEFSGRGLTEADLAALAGCEEATVIDVVTTGPEAAATLREAQRLVAALAKETGGLPWDEETRLTFSQAAWAELIEEGWEGDAPHVPSHTVIHAYRSGQLPRLITLGMAKLGLPDLVVEDCAASSGRSMATLINLASQTLFERPVLEAAGRLPVDLDGIGSQLLRTSVEGSLLEGAQRKGALSVVKGEREEGDPENRLVEIAFPREPGVGLAEAQKALLTRFFGAKDDLVQVRHDGELERVSLAARKRLLEIVKPGFRELVDAAGHLSVKAPFRTDDGGQEYMWIEVVDWKGKEIYGLLDNDPFYISNLEAGARVSVSEDSVFDYILERRDGTREGNETAKILERQAKGRE